MRRHAWMRTWGLLVMGLAGSTAVAFAEAAPPGQEESFLGVIIPRDSVELTSRFDTRLERVEVEVGEAVHQGQELAHLDTRELQQQLEAAEASLQGARAEEHSAAVALMEAREKKSRYFTPRSLELGVYSQEELSSIRYQERTAVARLQAAQAQTHERQAHVDELRQNLADATLVAPFDGTVASRPISPGARVQAGQPILRLLGTGGTRIRFAVPESAAPRLAPGQPLQVAAREGGQKLVARLESVAPEVDAAARMVFAIAAFPQPPPRALATGTVVDVRLQPGERVSLQESVPASTPTRGP